MFQTGYTTLVGRADNVSAAYNEVRLVDLTASWEVLLEKLKAGSDTDELVEALGDIDMMVSWG